MYLQKMKEMKRKFRFISSMSLLMMLAATFTGCSSDEDIQSSSTTTGNDKINVSLGESGFGEEQTSRGIFADTYVVDSQRVDLGDGLKADVIVTKDPVENIANSAVATRAEGDGQTVTARTGDYVIYACVDGTYPPTCKFTGTWNGSNFTNKKTYTCSNYTFSNAGTDNWTIANGTYRFICCYDTKKLSSALNASYNYDAYFSCVYTAEDLTDAEKEEFLISDPISGKTITDGQNLLNFTMKHKSCGMKFKISSTGAISNNVEAFCTAASGDVYNIEYYRLNQSSVGMNTGFSKKNAAVSKVYYLNDVIDNTSTTKTALSTYKYFLANNDASKYKLTFVSGTVDGKALATKSLNLNSFSMEEGKRYTVNIKIVTAPKYTVTYYANGGSTNTTWSTNPHTEGINTTSTTVLANQFTAPTGSNFIEWNTSADGTGTDYEAGAALNLSGNVTLYALWSRGDNNLIWAPANLVKIDGTTRFAQTLAECYPTPGSDGIIASGSYADWSSYGSKSTYWQFDKLDPIAIGSNYSASWVVGTNSWATANDPCKLVVPAGTWRLPTESEANTMATWLSSNTSWTTVTQSGYNYNGRIDGTWDGTMTNSFFLPAAGCITTDINVSGELFLVGTAGIYWTSDTKTTNITNNSYNLTFSNIGTIGVNVNGQNEGYSIRCVRAK